MLYKELIQFEPINEVVQFSKTAQIDYQKTLIKSFVFSDAYKEHLIPLMVRNLDYTQTGDSFGLQVVGNYGTGKSHLMSLVSIIAENEEMIELISEAESKEALRPLAGKFKVLRFELGNTESLWEVVSYKIEDYLDSLGVHFSFETEKPLSYYEKIQLMMAEFEEKFPDKGLMIVIDEMLSYLKGRSEPAKLNTDLAVLQALGQASDSSKFKIIFGVQEMIYQSPEFQFAAEMLQKVADRYKDIQITKDDVSFIVKNRLLKKDEHQKQKIKEHLDPFLKFFSDMHARTQDYVELFPVHPSYFENFEKIKIGKSQREILKTLSGQFSELLDQHVPSDNPGLLTYDKYWTDVTKNQNLMAIPDVRSVKQIADLAKDKIQTHFVGVREVKKGIAERIVNACSIRLLQADLSKQNGTTTENLVDDLCLTDKNAFDRDFLIDIIDSTAGQVITATSGQYFDKDADNGEFHLRIEGGVNFDQKIKDYAATMSSMNKDEYFFKFLGFNLPLDHDTYRTGFKIWEHSLDWKSHKTYRDGYIFFGNPNEKSTTQPRQHFYMYFMPIFDESKKVRNHVEDEVYFVMDELSEEFKTAVILYGAALSLEVRADSAQKVIYKQKIGELNKKARSLFDQEYVQITKVDYMGKELPLKGYNLPGAGSTKEQVFSEVASTVFEECFENENDNYPRFTQINGQISKDNFGRYIKSALSKISKPEQANRDGEGILSGLGLYVPGMLDYSHSPYAKSLLKMLKDKGEGMVLNRDEILECIWPETNLWLSKDYQIECDLQFLVMATLAALGEIEITLSSGKAINSTNLGDLLSCERSDFFAFTHIKTPKGLNIAALKEMFIGLLGRDLSAQLKDQATYVVLAKAASAWSDKTVKIIHDIRNGINYNGIEIISLDQVRDYNIKFIGFSRFCDKLGNYTSEAKMKNFRYSVEEVKHMLEAKPLVEKVENQLQLIEGFKSDISYLQQCKQYLLDLDFKEKITATISLLGEKLATNDSKGLDAYTKELEHLKNIYADSYLKAYLQCRISEADNTQKQALLDSDQKQICDILKEADILSAGQYQHLLANLDKLIPADPLVNKNTILAAPYQDFNPLDYSNQQNGSVKSLKMELSDLLYTWIDILKDTLEDPMVKKKINLLTDEEQQLLKDFKSDKVAIDKSNALKIRNAIMNLHKGLEKVELSTESLKQTFNKPLTPDEAIEAFKAYIDKVSVGKERDKIRIILK